MSLFCPGWYLVCDMFGHLSKRFLATLSIGHEPIANPQIWNMWITGANRKSPSCKVYNPKNVHCRSTGLPHALLLMKISPTDAHEEKPFWPFGAMKREPGWFGHAQVRAFGTIPGPLPYPREILLQGFGHRVRVRALTQTTIWGFGNLTLLQNDWFGHSCRQLGGFGHLPFLRNKLLLAFEMT